ncbi:MAG TPA: hypothetical protein VGN26_16990 [Armatimonadota bacterium]|jgi:hypothetical protein
MRPFRVWIPGSHRAIVMATTMRQARQRFIDHFEVAGPDQATIEYTGILPQVEPEFIRRAREEGTLLE